MPLAALVLLAPLSPALPMIGRKAESLLPNYADRMLSPYETRAVTPQLVPVRRTTPIRVGFEIRPELDTAARRAIVRSACYRWESATSARGVAGFRFVVVASRRPQDADIFVSFERMRVGDSEKGCTREQDGRREHWAWTQVAVEDSDGQPLAPETILRVATHEIGHALGIWGHSPDATDIMSIAPETPGVSLADVNTLRIAYGR